MKELLIERKQGYQHVNEEGVTEFNLQLDSNTGTHCKNFVETLLINI